MAFKGVLATKPSGKGKERKEPISSAAQARDALSRMNQTKPPLTEPQRRTVAREALKYIGHRTPAINRILGGTK